MQFILVDLIIIYHLSNPFAPDHNIYYIYSTSGFLIHFSGGGLKRNFYILSKKKRTICVKKYPLDGWMDELQTGPVGYMLKIPIG